MEYNDNGIAAAVQAKAMKTIPPTKYLYRFAENYHSICPKLSFFSLLLRNGNMCEYGYLVMAPEFHLGLSFIVSLHNPSKGDNMGKVEKEN